MLFFYCCISVTAVDAQPVAPADTLRLGIPDAEAIFLQKNLSLLASQYNVDINKALAEQARVWDNPVLNTDQNVYDGRFFRHTKDYGQIYIQVQQLIKTGGKIKKQTLLAQDNVLTAHDQFDDLLRNLKYSLTTDMNNLAQLQEAATVYKTELETMQNLAKGMDEVYKVGDISKKENIRVKALLFSLRSDYNDNQVQQIDIQKDLATLLQLSDNAWVVVTGIVPVNTDYMNAVTLSALQDTAMHNRPDVRGAVHQQLYQQHNIAYQKALAVPDLTVGPEYDRLNSYTPNYVGLAISLPLPLFNKNKGNIKASEIQYKQSGTTLQQVRLQAQKEVQGAYLKLANATSMLNTDYGQLHENYDEMMNNMTNSYKERQISLLEFIDFFDSYKDVRLKQNQLITSQRNAAAELNFSTNQNVIKL